MSAPHLTRRALIGTVAGAATVAIIPVGADTSSGMPAFDSKVAAYRCARDAWLAYRHGTFDVMDAASCEARSAIPHERTSRTFTNILGEQATFSTERWSLATAKLGIEDFRVVQPDYLAAAQEAVELAKRRDEKMQAIDARFNVAAIEQREAELSDADAQALRVVLVHPSASIAEVLAKLRFIVAEDAWELTPAQEGIIADLERIVGRTA